MTAVQRHADMCMTLPMHSSQLCAVRRPSPRDRPELRFTWFRALPPFTSPANAWIEATSERCHRVRTPRGQSKAIASVRERQPVFWTARAQPSLSKRRKLGRVDGGASPASTEGGCSLPAASTAHSCELCIGSGSGRPQMRVNSRFAVPRHPGQRPPVDCVFGRQDAQASHPNTRRRQGVARTVAVRHEQGADHVPSSRSQAAGAGAAAPILI